MKVTIEIDCSPEEARRVMGLPDLTPLHELYVAAMRDGMRDAVRPEQMEAMMKSWAPMGDAGLAVWRQLFETGGGKPGG